MSVEQNQQEQPVPQTQQEPALAPQQPRTYNPFIDVEIFSSFLIFL